MMKKNYRMNKMLKKLKFQTKKIKIVRKRKHKMKMK